MTVSLRRLLVAAILVGVAIGIPTLVYFLVPAVLGPYGSDTQGRTAAATVTKTAACDANDAHDTVTFTVAGKQRQAMLNGCGNAKGERLRVALPDSLGSNPVVQPVASTQGVVPPGYRRVGYGLLVLAGLAGTGYCYLVIRGGPTDRDDDIEAADSVDAPAAA